MGKYLFRGKIRNWLRWKLSNWLGVDSYELRVRELEVLYRDLVSIGVDVHFKDPSMILIYSHLKGGQIRQISANFESIAELNDLVERLKHKYKTSIVIRDMPGQCPGRRQIPTLEGWDR